MTQPAPLGGSPGHRAQSDRAGALDHDGVAAVIGENVAGVGFLQQAAKARTADSGPGSAAAA
nr:hypothetical protein [Streptomyces sp. S1D4-11]QIY93283.1 hypothetical protein HEP87_02720 [Streptomyces sp. S1D4-11]